MAKSYGTWEGAAAKAVVHLLGHVLGGDTPENRKLALAVLTRVGHPGRMATDGTIGGWLRWGKAHKGASESPKSRSRTCEGAPRPICPKRAAALALSVAGVKPDVIRREVARCSEAGFGRKGGGGVKIDRRSLEKAASALPDPAKVDLNSLLRPRK